jgi:N-acetylneuraminic acid mutarotase
MRPGRYVLLLTLMLGAALSCINFEQEHLNRCARTPEECPPEFLVSGYFPDPQDNAALTFLVKARDPQGGGLQFLWQTAPGIGTLSDVHDDDPLSQRKWVPPLCTPNKQGVLVITVKVTNDLGVSSVKHFDITDIPLCPPWAETTTMDTERASHTATRLATGALLLAGGEIQGRCYLDRSDIYDPNTEKKWVPTVPMTTPRAWHSATLLPSGQVLVTGGVGLFDTQSIHSEAKCEDSAAGIFSGSLSSAEIYDLGQRPPEGNRLLQSQSHPFWSSTNSMKYARAHHTATLVSTSKGRQKVMVAGGDNVPGVHTDTSEEYDIEKGIWSESVGKMWFARAGHTATLLSTGKVLVIGGTTSGHSASSRNSSAAATNVTLASAELYDPDTGTWTLLPHEMATPRTQHTATLLPSGKVLVTGGFNNGVPLSSSEIFDPAALLDPSIPPWSTAESLIFPRAGHTAVLLTSGKVLIAGGVGTDGPLSSVEEYDPDKGSWSLTGPFAVGRSQHSATLLFSGKVLVIGGVGPSGYLSSAELYTPDREIWESASSMTATRYYHATTLLPSGKVLVTGGNKESDYLATTEMLDPIAGTWSPAGNMTTARAQHTATVLSSGKVLVVGGVGPSSYLASAEIYDPISGTWAPTGSMAEERYAHTATLLPSGKVLVSGGYGNTGYLASAEVYDPTTETWSPTASMVVERSVHTATLLTSGKVLVTGGESTSGYLSSAEVYDPITGTWSLTGSMTSDRSAHNTILLSSGQVLVTGGESTSNPLSSAEVYNPATSTWSLTGSMNSSRFYHTTTLLPSKKVLVTGGSNPDGYLSSAEVYDPTSGTWSSTSSMASSRTLHTATALPSGKVLVTGGIRSGGEELASTEVFTP